MRILQYVWQNTMWDWNWEKLEKSLEVFETLSLCIWKSSATVKSSSKILLLPEQKISLLEKVGMFLNILPFSILFLQFQKIFNIPFYHNHLTPVVHCSVVDH